MIVSTPFSDITGSRKPNTSTKPMPAIMLSTKLTVSQYETPRACTFSRHALDMGRRSKAHLEHLKIKTKIIAKKKTENKI